MRLRYIKTISAALALAAATAAAAIPRFSQVGDGVYRGGRPNADDAPQLRAVGVVAILDLEGGFFGAETDAAREERRWAEAAGFKFYLVPMHPLRAPTPARIDETLAIMTDAANRPVFVHCTRGTDRTGVVVAAYRVAAEGWTPEEAYEEMLRLGFHRHLLFWWKGAFFRWAAARGG